MKEIDGKAVNESVDRIKMKTYKHWKK